MCSHREPTSFGRAFSAAQRNLRCASPFSEPLFHLEQGWTTSSSFIAPSTSPELLFRACRLACAVTKSAMQHFCEQFATAACLHVTNLVHCPCDANCSSEEMPSWKSCASAVLNAHQTHPCINFRMAAESMLYLGSLMCRSKT